MAWTHYYEGGAGDKTFIYNLKIITYPSYILLSPEGRILFRSDEHEKKDALNRIKSLFGIPSIGCKRQIFFYTCRPAGGLR